MGILQTKLLDLINIMKDLLEVQNQKEYGLFIILKSLKNFTNIKIKCYG
jgi:hypothetical protein